MSRQVHLNRNEFSPAWYYITIFPPTHPFHPNWKWMIQQNMSLLLPRLGFWEKADFAKLSDITASTNGTYTNPLMGNFWLIFLSVVCGHSNKSEHESAHLLWLSVQCSYLLCLFVFVNILVDIGSFSFLWLHTCKLKWAWKHLSVHTWCVFFVFVNILVDMGNQLLASGSKYRWQIAF